MAIVGEKLTLTIKHPNRASNRTGSYSGKKWDVPSRIFDPRSLYPKVEAKEDKGRDGE